MPILVAKYIFSNEVPEAKIDKTQKSAEKKSAENYYYSSIAIVRIITYRPLK